MDFGLWTWTLDFGLWTLDFGLETLDLRLWTLDFGLWNITEVLEFSSTPMDFGLETLHFGLWNITDVLEFSSTLMEKRTLDARGVLVKKYLHTIYLPSGILASTAQSTVISSSLSNLAKLKLNTKYQNKIFTLYYMSESFQFQCSCSPTGFFVIGCICSYIDGPRQLSR